VRRIAATPAPASFRQQAGSVKITTVWPGVVAEVSADTARRAGVWATPLPAVPTRCDRPADYLITTGERRAGEAVPAVMIGVRADDRRPFSCISGRPLPI